MILSRSAEHVIRFTFHLGQLSYSRCVLAKDIATPEAIPVYFLAKLL